jgi:hydrogenase 3 maturation protease
MEKMKMSKISWRASLKNRLSQLSGSDSAGRIAILGIGNDLRGDDAAGVLVARRLLSIPGFQNEHVLVLDTGGLPENFSGVLRRFQPDAILFIDAAALGAPPGEIQWVEWDRLVDHGFSHGLPLSTLAQFLKAELGCWIGLLAIEGQNLGFGDPVSPAARRAVRRVIQELKGHINCNDG